MYQVICLALQNAVFIKISYQDHQGFVIRLHEISSGTFHDVTERLSEALAVQALRRSTQRERENQSTLIKSWVVILH